MAIGIWIEPHEREEAIHAYRDWLNDEQVEAIRNAPDGALISVVRCLDGATEITVVEEG